MRKAMLRNFLATLRIKGNTPFDKLVVRLEQSILPLMQKWSKELESDFENARIRLNAVRSDNHPRLPQKYSYHITIECGERDALKTKLGDLTFAINLSQFDAKSDPTISAYVGMLVDEESGDDWAIHPILVLFPFNQRVEEGILERLENSLPDLYQALRKALGRTGKKEIRIQQTQDSA